MAEDLRRFVNRHEISARRAGPLERTVKWVRRRPAVAAALAGCFVLALCALGFAAQAHRSQLHRQAEHRQRSLDAALAASMSGNFKAAESSIKAIEVQGGSPGQVRVLRGLVHFQTGEFDPAMDELRQAITLMPKSVAARGILAVVYNHAWYWSEYETTLQQLDGLTPVSPEDHLFQGYALSFINPIRALASLDQAIRLRDTAMACAIRGEVRGECVYGYRG